MSDDIEINKTMAAMKEVATEVAHEQRAKQIDSKASFMNAVEDTVNPFVKLASQQEEIKTRLSRSQEMKKALGTESILLPIEEIKESAEQFHQQNPELKQDALVELRKLIKPGDTKEEILQKVRSFYPDVSLADEALDFLLATTDGETAEAVRQAKEELNKEHGREITAGKNIAAQAQQAATKGLGTPTSLRELYRDITGNQRDAPTLFDELSGKYAFKQLADVIKFLFRSVGADLRSEGPSIPHGMLHNLMAETRALQAILGVYRFFQGRMGLIDMQFNEQQLDKPPQLNFENIAKQFMALVADRYPAAAKVLQLASKMGIDGKTLAMIIIFSQMRDAVRQVAREQIYKSLQHRDDLYLAILEALEELEDELEDFKDEEDEDDDDDEGQQQKKDSNSNGDQQEK